MSISQIPLSSLKNNQRGCKSQVNNFPYQLYECVQLLAVKKNGDEVDKKAFQDNVDILISSFYEGNGKTLLVLVCSNGHLLFFLREEGRKPIVKQLSWFQNPDKVINALCIDPVHGAWVLCACADSSVYLLPALAQMKDSLKNINSSLTSSLTDVSRVQYTKPLKGIPTCIVWWHTIDDQNVGIVGTQGGELVFLDLGQRQELCRTVLKVKIVSLELSQDIHERTSYLFIKTLKNWTLQLLLEQPSQNINFTSSLTQAFDMGYDMLTDCNVESILATDRKESKDEIQVQNRIEGLPQDFNYSIHHVKENIWIAKHDAKFSALEIFSDIKRVPEFIYHVPISTTNILLCNNLMFSIFKKDDKVSMSLLSRQLSTTSFGRQGLKKPDPSKRADLQTFQLDNTRDVIDCYKSQFSIPDSWQELFPHSSGYQDECDLNSFLLVTNDGIFECRPKSSPEHYFTELAIKDVEVAERLGITFDLNIPLLFEFIGDKIIQGKDIPGAMKFYHLSKSSPIKRAVNIVEYGSVTDALIYIKQVLKKQPTPISSKDKKNLADMAIACYIEQVLECQQGGTFSKNLSDSFRAFLCDNFDYDEDKAMKLLVTYGMLENLFEVGKARGKIDEALKLMACRGCFLLTTVIQNMLLDCGYSEKVCKACEGMFIKHLQPDEQVRFLLAQPEVSKPFLNKLINLLLQLDEAPLLLVARVFDPSRQFIKPFLEKADVFRRKRTGSGVSLGSTNSTVVAVDDPTSPAASEIIVMFLKTLITLNAKRKWSTIPDMRLISKHLSGQLSWTGSLSKRSDSLGSNEIVKSEVAKLKIACGRHHSAFVTSENDLYTWGKSSCGRLGHGDLVDEHATSQPMRVESLHMHGIQVLSVSCGALHTVALCQEGVFAWGSNLYGQLGVGDKRKRSRPVLLSEISSKYINSVVCGHYHTLAITIDSKLYAWGWGIHGQLGLASAENQILPQPVALLTDHRIIQAAAGYAHSAVLTSRGMVFTFGAGLYGQLGIGSNKKYSIPQLVDTLVEDSIYLIACGSFETLAVSEEQTIYCWGRNYHQFHICGKADNARYGRQMASSTTDISHRYLPEDLPFKLQQPITQLICGNWHYMAMTSVNYVYTWGCNDCGQLGHYNKIDQPAPRLVKALSRRCVSGIAAGSEFSVIVDAEEQVLAWGRADGGLIGIENEGTITSPVARRSTYSVLAPSLVPGLPIHFDQVSIGSGHSMGREYVFDQHYDLPDLSSVGQDQPPYSIEAVLLSLYKLSGLYNDDVVRQYASHLKQWFIFSFCCELKEQWDMAFTYRMRAIDEYLLKQEKKLTTFQYCEKTLLVVADLLKKFEDFLTEDLQENNSLVAMVKCMLKIFDFWIEHEFPFRRFEEFLRKHVESLCPLYTIVFFGYLADVSTCKSNVLRFSLHHVINQHAACKHFSKVLYDELLSQVMKQLDTGTNWYKFLSCSDEIDVTTVDKAAASSPVGESTLSRDDMLKEIIEHKRKLLNIKPYITLSNAVSTTLADASIAQKVSSSTNQNDLRSSDKERLDEPDSTVFSCNHNLPRYYMLETVIPEFISRMAELPEPLTHTAGVMSRYYRHSGIKIPMVCPYCVYNNLRNEQMHMLRETGGDIMNNKSTMWEI